MKFHIENPNRKYRPLCVKNFSRSYGQNYIIVSHERFAKLLKEEPKYCCKKCKNLKEV